MLNRALALHLSIVAASGCTFSDLNAQWDPPIPQWTGMDNGGLTDRDFHGCTDARGNVFLMAQAIVQRWDSLGYASWDFGVDVPSASVVNRAHMVVPDGEGGCFIGYVLNTGTIGPYIQHLDPSGAPLLPWPGQRVIAPASSSWADLWMVRDTSHLFVTITTDAINGIKKVYAQKLDLGLQRLWGDSGKVVSPAISEHRNIQCLADDRGGLVMLFRSYSNGNNTYMRMQRVDSVGAPLWGQGVPLHTTLPVGSFARAELRRGLFGDHYACWEGGSNAFNTGIYMNRVDSTGALPWGPEPLIVFDAPNKQDLPTLSVSANGDAYVAWRDLGTPFFKVGAQRVDTAGNLRWTPAIVVDGSALGECFPKFVREADGMRLFWTAYVGGYTRVLTQVFDGTGNAQCGQPGDTVGFVNFRNISDDLVLGLPQGRYVLVVSPTQFAGGAYLQITEPSCELVLTSRDDVKGIDPAIWPVPSNGIVSVHVPTGANRLTVVDQLGRAVLNQNVLSAGLVVIDLGSLMPGPYVLLADGAYLGRCLRE